MRYNSIDSYSFSFFVFFLTLDGNTFLNIWVAFIILFIYGVIGNLALPEADENKRIISETRHIPAESLNYVASVEHDLTSLLSYLIANGSDLIIHGLDGLNYMEKSEYICNDSEYNITLKLRIEDVKEKIFNRWPFSMYPSTLKEFKLPSVTIQVSNSE